MSSLTDDKAVRRFSIALVVTLCAVLIWIGVRPDSSVPPVPLSQYAGCYRSGDTQVQLTTDGKFVTDDGEWRYRIVPASPGKHPDLIAVDTMRALAKGRSLSFEHWPDGTTFPITTRNGWSVILKQSDGTAFRIDLVPATCRSVNS